MFVGPQWRTTLVKEFHLDIRLGEEDTPVADCHHGSPFGILRTTKQITDWNPQIADSEVANMQHRRPRHRGEQFRDQSVVSRRRARGVIAADGCIECQQKRA